MKMVDMLALYITVLFNISTFRDRCRNSKMSLGSVGFEILRSLGRHQIANFSLQFGLSTFEFGASVDLHTVSTEA